MLSAGDHPSAFALGCDDRGAGAPVVLLHPFPFGRDIWADLAGALSGRHRVLAVEAPGFGESPLPGGGFTIAGFADALAALLDARGVQRAAVLGLSLGGYAALALAARHPARLGALVLADTRAGADTAETRAAREGAIARIRGGDVAGYLDASFPRLLSPGAPPALLAALRARAETRPASLIAGLEALRDRPDRTGELPAIRVPTLVLRGAADQITPEADMRELAAAIPGAAFVSLPEAGHLANVEAPAAFARAVSAFLDGLPAGALA